MSELKRSLGLPMMVLYGVGTTIGAGIYALPGEIAGVSGMLAPFAFLLASVLAAFTACSFAELCGRFPRAAGAALYVENGFGASRLPQLVGLLVACSGVVSGAAMINGFVGYAEAFVPFGRGPVIVAVTLGLGAIAGWGISESVMIAAVITCLEVLGLVVVIGAGAGELASLPARAAEFVPGFDAGDWALSLSGGLLAFYAFIGFEDMVDVAEEVKDVRRTLPRAILVTLVLTGGLYVALMTIAVLAFAPDELAAESAPLVALFERTSGRGGAAIGLIGMVAILNGALIQVIMASRVLYGLASRGQLPSLFARVHGRTRTPLVATACVTLVMLGLALAGRLAALAATTSLIMLCVFAAVNLALWRVKGRSPASEGPVFPRWIPLVGFVVCTGFVLRELGSWLASS